MQHDDTSRALVEAASHMEQAAAALIDANEEDGKHREDFAGVPDALIRIAAQARSEAKKREI